MKNEHDDGRTGSKETILENLEIKEVVYDEQIHQILDPTLISSHLIQKRSLTRCAIDAVK